MDDDQGVAASRAGGELSSEPELAALHARAKQVFFAALEQPESERSAILDQLCQGDPALRAEVSSLLVHHRRESLLAADGAALSAGRSPDAPQASPTGQRISGILIERKVGEGGMSAVYLGHDARLGRRVAVKALHPRSDLDRETRSRFLREARVLSRLKHANICEIYGYEETPDGDYLILEYIDGQSLRQLRADLLPLRERDRIAWTLADALRIAHAAGVVHRDLKPENVMLTKDGQVKVLDFGIARLSGWEELAASAVAIPGSLPTAGTEPDGQGPGSGPLTHSGRILGTPHYMSPEQARGEPISPASDVFSLGLLLYELYLGRSVHASDLPMPLLLDRVQRGVVAPLDGLSRSRRRLLQRMLASEAALRPTMTEVVQALQAIRDQRARLILRGAVAAILAALVLAGSNYVLEVRRAWTQAEAARGQLDALADTLIDDMFNRLGARDRHILLERLGRLPLHVMSDLPDRLLRESLLRFAQRIGAAGRMRLLTGDSVGALTALRHMLWLDELAFSTVEGAGIRRQFTERLSQLTSASDGCVDPKEALSFYQRAESFYAHKLAEGRDGVRWRSRLALLQLVLGRTHLQDGNLPAARAAFHKGLTLCEGLLAESAGSQQRVLRYQSAQLLRWLAETDALAASFESAIDAGRRSIRGFEHLTRELPYVPDIAANRGESMLALGRVLHARGDLDAALAALDQARDILMPLQQADPSHSQLCTLLAHTWLTRARILRQRGQPAEADDALRAAAALTGGVTSDSLLTAQDVRAQVLLELGLSEEARPLTAQLVALGWPDDGAHRDFARLVAARPAR